MKVCKCAELTEILINLGSLSPAEFKCEMPFSYEKWKSSEGSYGGPLAAILKCQGNFSIHEL